MFSIRPRKRLIDGEGSFDRNRAWWVVEQISLVLVAMSAGAVALLFTIASRVADGISEPDEQAIFTHAWPLALGLVLVFPAIFRSAARRWLGPRTVFWPVLAVGHVSFWLRLIARVKAIGAETNAATRGAHLEHLLETRAWAPLGFTVAWFIACFILVRVARTLAARRRPRMEAVLEALASPWLGYLCLLVAAGELAWLAWPCAQLSYSTTALVSIGCGGVLVAILARHSLDEPRVRSFWSRWSGHLLVIGALTLLLWFPDIQVIHYPQGTQGSSAADIWIDHYNYYLGSVQAVLLGRSPLVDVSSQYGVGVAYAVALVFKTHLFPRSAVGMAHLICALQILRFFLLYLTLRKISRSLFVALCFVVIALGISAFSTKYVYVRLPNEGPLRFLVEYILVATIAFQWKRGASATVADASSRRWRARLFPNMGSLIVVAFGTVWSPDVAVTVVGAYLGTRALVAWRLPTRWRSRAAAFARDLFGAGVAIAIALLTIQLYVRASTGSWPIWDRAIEFIRFYASWNAWIVPIDTWSPWIVVALVYVGSLAAVVYDGRATIELQAVTAMTIAGISEMIYYVGRSYMENLAAVSLPAVFVALYWASRVLRATRGVFRFVLASAAATSALLTFLPTLPGGVAKLPYSLLVRTATGEQPAALTPSAEVQDAVNLMKKYVPRRRRVAIFLTQDAEVEALLLAGKTQMWPLSYPEADAILPRAHKDAVENWPPLHRGDIVFLSPKLDGFQQEIVDRITKRMQLTEIEATPSGVKAMRAEPL